MPMNCGKKILILSIALFLSFSWRPLVVFASGDSDESSIIKRESGEVVLKSSADCRDNFKSSFVRKIQFFISAGEIKKSRFERLKNEIGKTRERIASRFEKIQKTQANLEREKENLKKILAALDSAEPRFLKLKVVSDDSDETGLQSSRSRKIDSTRETELQRHKKQH